MDLNQEYTHDVELRLKGVVWIVVAFFIIVGIRLFYLQVIKGDYYRIFSENNSIKHVKIPAARGSIYDRDGELVVDNRPAFDLVVIPQYITNKEKLAEALAGVLEEKPENILSRLQISKTFPSYKPYVIAEDIDFNVVSKIRMMMSPFNDAKENNLDGVDIEYRYAREFPENDIASHVLGYVREVDKERLEKLEEKYPGKYERGDEIGINGIEEYYDIYIRGEKGFEEKVVDALGREVNYADLSLELFEKEAVRGGDTYLTLDLSLQRVAKEMLKDKKGAAVAIDPETGAVLAMYSSPSYDLTKLHTKDRSKYWAKLATDPDRPLYNRAVQGMYPPASTYKIITAAAAVEEGVIDRKEKIHCSGGLAFGNRVFGCWSSHGAMDLIRGIAWSCDVFFYTMGIRLGIDRIAKYAKLLGLGEKTGIELPGEKKGLIPTEEWKLKTKGHKWNPGETLSCAIGQGYNMTTPLQMALVTAEIANGGYKIKPHLVEKILGPDEKPVYEWTLKKEKIEGISQEALEAVREGMLNVVTSGTGRRLAGLNLDVAGKSGTAQVVSKKMNTGGKKHLPHAWFVGFAPYDKPKIAVAVLIENIGGGSANSGPVVGAIIKEYLNPDKKEEDK